jgi:hypothetical protein
MPLNETGAAEPEAASEAQPLGGRAPPSARLRAARTPARTAAGRSPRGHRPRGVGVGGTTGGPNGAPVDATAGALGIEDSSVRRRIGDLNDLFVARNQVSHELDLQRVEQRGDRTRRTRAMGPTTTLCDTGFDVAQRIIHAVGGLLAA